MRRVVVIAAIALVVVSGAVTYALVGRDDAPAARDRPAASGGSTTTSEPSTTTTTRPRHGSGSPVTFAFGGDVHFEGSLAQNLAVNAAGMFAPIAPELSAADVSMVNLETAITDRGAPDPKGFNFRAPPQAFDALRAAGVDVVTMANNHGRDYGPVGLLDTLAAIKTTAYPVVGVGADATAAYAPWRTEVRGQRIAVLGATDVIDDNLIAAWTATDTQAGLASAKGADALRLVQSVGEARTTSDTVIVYLHWGVEGATCPTPRQRDLAQLLTTAGADIVVGSHAHRVMGGGRLGAAFVDYGLGNFAFYNEGGLGGQTGVLVVTATGHDIDRFEWKPARITGGIPQLLGPPASDQARASWDAQRACTGLTP